MNFQSVLIEILSLWDILISGEEVLLQFVNAKNSIKKLDKLIIERCMRVVFLSLFY